MTRNELKIFLFLNLVRPHDRYCSFRSRFLPAISHKNSAVLRTDSEILKLQLITSRQADAYNINLTSAQTNVIDGWRVNDAFSSGSGPTSRRDAAHTCVG